MRPGGTALAKSRSFPERDGAARTRADPPVLRRAGGGAGKSAAAACESAWRPRRAGATLDHFELLRALYAHNATVGDASFVEDDPNRAHHRCYVNNELVNLMLNMICGHGLEDRVSTQRC